MTPEDSHASSSSPTGAPAQLLSHERLVVWASILSVTAISWFVVVRMPMPSRNISCGAVSGTSVAMGVGAAMWSLRDAALGFAMWTVMMAAMMLPSAGPMIEMHARIARGLSAQRSGRTWLFVAGYLIAWTGFAAAIVLAQYLLAYTGIIGDAMRLGPLGGGLLLIATGLYQITPLKQACLTKCRTPLGFFMTQWRAGDRGALLMGLNHGLFCVGCCWLLMTLMFVGGVMNLAWAAALTIFVLLEKAAPWGRAVSRASGVVMVASGVALVTFW
jgi:predicted metal-binding membrane protein